jgi:hypothetical protein
MVLVVVVLAFHPESQIPASLVKRWKGRERYLSSLSHGTSIAVYAACKIKGGLSWLSWIEVELGCHEAVTIPAFSCTTSRRSSAMTWAVNAFTRHGSGDRDARLQC